LVAVRVVKPGEKEKKPRFWKKPSMFQRKRRISAPNFSEWDLVVLARLSPKLIDRVVVFGRCREKLIPEGTVTLNNKLRQAVSRGAAVANEGRIVGHTAVDATALILAEEDAVAVTKLKLAGASIVGKTNTHEIALGVTGVNPNYGAVKNPWNTDHISGGSSSGSAVGR
jgi:hypothetical protein